MRKQDTHKAFETNEDVLAIFYGAHNYISASWYGNKQSASTWNYQAVHAKGNCVLLMNQGCSEVLTRLTEKFEITPIAFIAAKMDEAYVKQMMKAIVAFEIEITAVEHVFKLSQNKDEKKPTTAFLNN